jgi:predicted SAM-dependent methyltransferase
MKKIKNILKRFTTPSQQIILAKGLHFLLASFKRLKKKPTLTDFPSPYKLHLGCGNIRIEKFINIDVSVTSASDITDDIRKLGCFPLKSVSEIYACHVLEHFGHAEILPILSRWFALLIPGGQLRISVPDIDRIVKIYSKNLKHFETPGNSPWIGLIYGGQSTPYDFHKTGYNACWLKHLLEKAGFENCEEYPHYPHFAGVNSSDASLANEPFGEYLSLNMIARRPAT